jgi:hypothetical protein
MWYVKIGAALGTVALTGFVGAGIGMGYYLFKVSEHEKE